MPRTRAFPGLLALVGSLCLAASALAVEHKVIVTDNPTESFVPQYLTVQAGDTVTWQNVAGTHNVVADDASFTSGSPASAPWTYSHGFPTEGRFTYSCSLHVGDGQVGTIVVRPARASNEIAYTVNAWDMERTAPATLAESHANDFVRQNGELRSSVHLPAGAKITGIEISACDDISTPNSQATLYVCPEPDSPCSQIISVIAQSDQADPDCRVWQSSHLDDGPVVDNANNTYGLKVLAGLGVRSAKIYYKKVLSPAPATATFSDVPTTDLAFRAVEALAASGITQGCGNGQFCPNDSVTRGQMAIFLARAFGLFWPN